MRGMSKMRLDRWLGAVLATAVTASAAQAAIIVTAEDVILDQPISGGPLNGSFEIYVQLTGNEVVDAIAYEVSLQLQPLEDGIVFTEVVDTLSRDQLFGDPVAGSDAVGFTFGNVAERADFELSGSERLTDGIGLGRVNFTVAPDVSGTFALEFIPQRSGGFGTFFIDTNNQVIMPDFEAGSITVNAVPEPALGVALPLLTGLVLCRRRRFPSR